MTKLMQWIVRHPVLSLIFLVVVMVILSVKIMTVEIDSSAEGLMAEGDPERLYYETIKEKFGSDTLTVIVIEAKGGDIFQEESLRFVETLTDKVGELNGVTNIQSLTTVNKIKGEGDFLNTNKLIEEVPTNPEELKQLREDTLRNDVFINNIISKDGKIAGINIFTENRENDKKFNETFTKAVDKIVEEYKGDHRAYQIGNPIAKVTFSSYIVKDQQTLTPIAVVFLIVLLFFTLRSSIAALLPILTGGLSIGATIGFMTLMGYPVNVVTAIIPALLIAIGCTEDIHMITEYFEGLRHGKNKKEAIMYMAGKCALPIALTSATTVFGFSSLALNKITILKQFGIVATFGLAINFLITIIVIPAFLQFLPVPKIFKTKTRKSTVKKTIDAFTDWFIKLTTEHKVAVTVCSLLVVAIAAIGCFKVKVNTDFISYFKEGSFIKQRISSIHKDLSGAMNFNIIIETGKEDKVKDPEVLKQIAMLQEYMKGMGTIDKSISLADHIKMMHRELNGGKKEFQVVPDSRNLIAQYLLLMSDEDTKTYVDSNCSTASIIVRHNVTSSASLTEVLDKIKAYVDKNFAKDLIVRFTGEGILINNAADYMAKGQVTSLGSSLLTIFAVMALLFMSIKAGIVSMIPNIVPIVLNFGVMGWFGIPLNTGTCMVAAIALGIAVDDTTHFMARYNRELKETHDQKQAIANSLKGEGEPVLLSSVALAVGFVILAASQFNPTIHFGLLSALVMIFGYASEMLITPILLSSVQLVSLWDFLAVSLKWDLTKSPIFTNFSRSEAKKVILLGSIRSVPSDEYIIRQGEKGQEMYMLISGKVRVTVEVEGKTKELGTLKEGDIVGEMALIGGGIRSANIVALEDTELLKIDEKSLERIRKRFPRVAAKLFMNISRILSDRLRTQNLMSVGGS